MNCKNENSERNSIHHRLLSSLSLLAVTALLAQPVYAQNASQDGEVDEIIVTAQRKEQSILDVPVSASVFNAKKIELANFDDAKDYLLETPNVSFQQGGRNGAREIIISIRGISSLKGGEKVLTQSPFTTYVDEFSAGTLAQGQANPDIYDVEAVEILRGPQGVFFGRNSEGGAINIRYKKPSKESYGRIDAGVGSFNTYELGGVVNGAITDDLFGRLTVHGEKTDGPLTNRHISGGKSDAQFVNIRGQLRWQPSDMTTLDLQVGHTIDNSGIQPKIGSCINQGAFGLPFNLASQSLLGGIGCYDANGEFTTWATANPGRLGGLTLGQIRNNTDSVYQDQPDHTDNTTSMLVGKLYHELNDKMAFTAILGYSESDQDQFLDLDRSGVKAINRRGAFEAQSYSAEARLSSIGENNIDWTFGGIVYNEEFNGLNQIIIEQLLGPWVPGDKANENRLKNEIKGYAAFANIEWHVSDQLSLIAGGRYSHDTGTNTWTDVFAACGRRAPGDPLDTSTAVDGNGACELTPDQNDLVTRLGSLPVYGGFISGGRYAQNTGRFATNSNNDFSPRVALNWKPSDNGSLYASVSKGYKPAGGQGNPDGGLGITSEFEKETLWNYEIGGNAYLMDRRLLVQGAVFLMDWNDYQFLSRSTLCVLAATGQIVPVTSSLDLTTCSRQLQVDGTQNLPKARSKGAEITTAFRVTDSLTVNGSLGYLDAKYIEGTGIVGGAPTDLAGIKIGNAPKWTASAGAEQTFDLMGGEGAVAASWTYRARTSLGVTETANLTFPSSVAPISLFNLRLSQSWGNNRITVNVDNLFNKEYYTATEGFSFVGPQLSYNPRTYSVKLTSEF